MAPARLFRRLRSEEALERARFVTLADDSIDQVGEILGVRDQDQARTDLVHRKRLTMFNSSKLALDLGHKQKVESIRWISLARE